MAAKIREEALPKMVSDCCVHQIEDRFFKWSWGPSWAQKG